MMIGRILCIVFSILIFDLSSFVSSAVCQNWTIGTGGKNRWFYGQYSQLGSRGFFGPYDVDAPLGNLASLNGWMGVQAGNILVSGTNSSATTMSTELNPDVTLGWATVTGRYRMRPYDTGTSPGSEVPISPGEWTHWKMGVTMPVGGAIFMGKNYFRHGCGLQFSWNRTQEYVLFESHPIEMPDFLGRLFPWLVSHPRIKPIAPLIVQICRRPKICPKDHEKPKKDCSDGSNYLEFTSEEEISQCVSANPEECVEVDVCENCPSGMLPVKMTDPGTKSAFLYKKRSGTVVYEEFCDNSSYLKFGLGVLPWEREPLIFNPAYPFAIPIVVTVPDSWNVFDVNHSQRVNLLAYLLWNNEVINFEIGTLFSSFHAGPELARSTDDRLNFVPTNRYNSEGWVYLEYWNGRLRLRTELDWFVRQTRFQPSVSGNFFTISGTGRPDGSGSLFAPEFIESLRFMADARVQFGSTAFTVFYSHMPGPDRRHGILVKKQPFIRQVQQAGLDPFYSVSSLLAYRYGSGVNSFGDLADASAIAARVDYAIAANLNLNATFLHATRVSHGYGWGWIRPSPISLRFGSVDYDPELQSYIMGRPVFNEYVPAIPSRDLGWEVGAGFQWQLLNQFAIELTFSYWQPGKWFNYACVDKSVLGWGSPSAQNNWGVNPNRTIDPVFGIEMVLLSSF